MTVIGRARRKCRELYYNVSRPKAVKHAGAILPPLHLRLCSSKMRDNEYFLRSAELEAERVVVRLRCAANDRVLDIGSGSGRLPIGLARRLPVLEYHGVDVLHRHVQWCSKWISSAYPSYQFSHLDVYSERYNRTGARADTTFRLPFQNDHFHIVYLYAVLTNMAVEDARIYLREIRRVAKPGARIFISAFVEDGVPDVSVNPDGYLGLSPQGPLHIVRYERTYFLSLLHESGLKVDAVERMGVDFDFLTAFYLSK
jgi:SAM-dependent methyltransferase